MELKGRVAALSKHATKENGMKLGHMPSARASILLSPLSDTGGAPFYLGHEHLGCCRPGNAPLASPDTLVEVGEGVDVQAPCTAVENSVTKLPVPCPGAVPAGHSDNGKLEK